MSLRGEIYKFVENFMANAGRISRSAMSLNEAGQSHKQIQLDVTVAWALNPHQMAPRIYHFRI